MALIISEAIRGPLLGYLCSRPYESVKDLIPHVKAGKLGVNEVGDLLNNVIARDAFFNLLCEVRAQGLAVVASHNAVVAEVERRRAFKAASTLCEAALEEEPAMLANVPDRIHANAAEAAKVLMTLPGGSSGTPLDCVLRHSDLPDNVASEPLTFV